MSEYFPTLGFDPAPGSPESVSTTVEALRRASADLDQARQELIAARAGIAWEGASAEAYQATAQRLADALAGHAEAVERVRVALAGWWPQLAANRTRALALEAEAAASSPELGRAAVVTLAHRLHQEHEQQAGEAVQAIQAATQAVTAAPLQGYWAARQLVQHAASAAWLAQQGLGGIPAPSSPAPRDKGSGPWGVDGPATAEDWATKLKWVGIADAAEMMGLVNAARHLRHYLANSGAPLQVDPLRIMRDVPAFRGEVEAALAQYGAAWRQQALQELAQSGGKPVRFTVEARWKQTYIDEVESRDWYFALGGVDYAWDEGKSTYIPGIGTVSDGELGRLHRVGLAREYQVWGVSTELERTLGGGEPAPSGPAPGGREGTRADPARERA